MNDLHSFTTIDLDPLLAEWEDVLNIVRVLYEERIGNPSANTREIDTGSLRSKAPRLRKAISGLHDAVQSNSQAQFDSFFATLPLGEGGKSAAYWVHPENVVEVQILVLQHARSYAVHRPSAASTPVGTLSRKSSYSATSPSRRNSTTPDQDTGLLIVDDQDAFVQHQSAITLEDKESTVGTILQNSAVSARWTDEDVAIVAAQDDGGDRSVKEIVVRRKYLAAAVNPNSSAPASKAAVPVGNDSSRSIKEIEDLRSWFATNPRVRPLATIASSRQRFTNIAADSAGFLLATLDKNISMRKSDSTELSSIDTVFSSNDAHDFPHAVLRVRQEGTHTNDLLRVLDSSHLVERVRGFSLEYHAVWQCCQPENTVAPFWVS